jgi:hypothetical protein
MTMQYSIVREYESHASLPFLRDPQTYSAIERPATTEENAVSEICSPWWGRGLEVTGIGKAREMTRIRHAFRAREVRERNIEREKR